MNLKFVDLAGTQREIQELTGLDAVRHESEHREAKAEKLRKVRMMQCSCGFCRGAIRCFRFGGGANERVVGWLVDLVCARGWLRAHV